MDCYKLIDGVFQPVVDPTDVGAAKDVGDVAEAIFTAGYTIRLCSSEADVDTAAISVYETANRALPRYYIDVMGVEQGVVSLLADDFPALIATLKELSGLIALLGIGQSVTFRSVDSVKKNL